MDKCFYDKQLYMDEAVLLKQALLEKMVLFAIKLLRKKDVLGKTLLLFEKHHLNE